MASVKERIQPQPGAQWKFSACPADGCIYGGHAGSAKSWALVYEPLKWEKIPGFTAAIFRRTSPQITNPGAIWGESQKLYRDFGGQANRTNLEWSFPSSAIVKFAQLQFDETVYDWQSAQLAFIGYDQIEQFTWFQFNYMLSRMRSTCGVRPYFRATCNPWPGTGEHNSEPGNWLYDAEGQGRGFIDWWIDDRGFPIPERSGVIRWFVVVDDRVEWADNEQALLDRFPELAKEGKVKPMSFTFIEGKITDNQILLKANPGYLAALQALDRVQRERLLHGNWKSKATAGQVFRREWFEVVDAAPAGCQEVRGWDLAATESRAGADPDWTVGLKMLRSKDGVYYIADIFRARITSLKVEQAIKSIAGQDGQGALVRLPQDPGQAGVAQKNWFARILAGFNFKVVPETKSKIERAAPFSAQCEAGNVKLVRGAWNEPFLQELQQFPDGPHDDQVDAASGAFEQLARNQAPVTFWIPGMEKEQPEQAAPVVHGKVPPTARADGRAIQGG
jgi:predicted phage terminase large subunit-like protein